MEGRRGAAPPRAIQVGAVGLAAVVEPGSGSPTPPEPGAEAEPGRVEPAAVTRWPAEECQRREPCLGCPL